MIGSFSCSAVQAHQSVQGGTVSSQTTAPLALQRRRVLQGLAATLVGPNPQLLAFDDWGN